METYAKKSKSNNGLQFTDPTGTIAPAGMPLNFWIEISVNDAKN